MTRIGASSNPSRNPQVGPEIGDSVSGVRETPQSLTDPDSSSPRNQTRSNEVVPLRLEFARIPGVRTLVRIVVILLRRSPLRPTKRTERKRTKVRGSNTPRSETRSNRDDEYSSSSGRTERRGSVPIPASSEHPNEGRRKRSGLGLDLFDLSLLTPRYSPQPLQDQLSTTSLVGSYAGSGYPMVPATTPSLINDFSAPRYHSHSQLRPQTEQPLPLLVPSPVLREGIIPSLHSPYSPQRTRAPTIRSSTARLVLTANESPNPDGRRGSLDHPNPVEFPLRG